ncbi:hypothetical protein LRS13_09525 [Svornostia abyssi]|uniref:Uncharacterized protein n=1 Tax=Svornostia abyssi TaxID=2898438 RepID=A0ABY5PM24_9ACTN|nr:hypothetical protein LRS13_09525 [Parviterribacteraceae bacterium J379]
MHLLFVDDPRSPTTADDWAVAIRDASTELGLPGRIDYVGHLLLAAD